MHNVRRIRIENGETVTVAGTAGKAGAEDKRGVAATFNQPAGIWGDGSDLYVADLSNYAIRRLTAPRTGSEPALTSITPARTSTGTTATFTISGSNFIPGETSIVVNGPGTRLAGINVGSSTSLDVAIDIARSGARTVRVVLSSGTSNPIAFEIGDRPDLTRTSFAIAGRGGFSTITANNQVFRPQATRESVRSLEVSLLPDSRYTVIETVACSSARLRCRRTCRYKPAVSVLIPRARPTRVLPS